MNKRSILRKFALIIIVLSIGLLIREGLQYNNLPGMEDPISQMADFFKYKENAVTNSFIWLGSLASGLVIYFITRK